jgi:hypothetical protein
MRYLSTRPQLVAAPRPFVAALFIIIAFIATAAVAADRLTRAPIPKGADWDYQIDAQGALWLLYYDEGRVPVLRDPTATTRGLTPPDATAAPSGAGLIPLKESGVLTLWRSKQPKKSLYLSRSDRPLSETLDIGGDSEPSKRFVAERIGDRLAVLWVGEGDVEGSEATYHLYFREVALGSDALNKEALSDVEHLFPGYYPVWAASADGTLIAFSWIRDDAGARIVSRTRVPDGNAFGAPVTVAEVPLITPIFRAFRSGDRTIVLWLAQLSKAASDFQLQGAYSDDDGEAWTRISFDALRGYDVGSLDIATDTQGHVAIALAARQRENPNEKRDIWLLTSADRGSSWSAPQPLRDPAVRGKFNAQNPLVAFGSEPGQMIVVWQDWRNIRSRLYASYSTDFGRTWSLSNILLPHETGVNLGLNPFVSALYTRADGFHVIAEQAVDDRLKANYLVHLRLNPAEMAQFATRGQSDSDAEHTGSTSITAEAADKDGADVLRQRHAEFWAAMVRKDYNSAYAFYDPFFRSRVTAEGFVSRLGRVHYAAYEVTGLNVDGPVAEVQTKVRYSIGPFQSATTGEIISRPEQETTVPETWLLVDGTWYREFNSEIGDVTFTPY